MLNDLDDLIKVIEGFGDMTHNTSVVMDKIFSKLNRFNRYFMFESNKLSRYQDLYYYPNNRRRFKGKPLVRNRAFAKAYKNDMTHNTSVVMDKIFSKLNRFNRYFMFESNKLSRYQDLYYYPNNRRRFKGKPLVRNRAFAKAYKNERRK